MMTLSMFFFIQNYEKAGYISITVAKFSSFYRLKGGNSTGRPTQGPLLGQ
jgi:hypothetical protein